LVQEKSGNPGEQHVCHDLQLKFASDKEAGTEKEKKTA
jgi:hypothetical protein